MSMIGIATVVFIVISATVVMLVVSIRAILVSVANVNDWNAVVRTLTQERRSIAFVALGLVATISTVVLAVTGPAV